MIRIIPSLQPLSRIFIRPAVNFGVCVLCIRGFSSLKQDDEQRNKDDIETWVRYTLQEPTSPRDTLKLEHKLPKKHILELAKEDIEERLISIVSKEEYLRQWDSKFKLGDINIANLVILEIQKERKGFALSQLVILLESMNSRRMYYEIHEIYLAYKNYMPFLRNLDHNKGAEHLFIEIMINAEANLKNFQLCESLFSEYIKYSDVKTQIISLGLRSFIENGNLQLAKEFFIQALKNPDTFVMTNNELYLFLRDLSKYNDFSSIKLVFYSWLTHKCEGTSHSHDVIPDFRSLSLVHRMFKLFNDESGLKELLSNHIVNKTGYENSVLYEITEFCQEIRNCKSPTSGLETQSKVEYFLLRLNSEILERRNLYLSLLNAFVSARDINNLKYVMTKIRDDKDIPLSGIFHITIARYFVKRGLFDHLIEYYSSVLKKKGSRSLRLRIGHIQQLWDCTLRSFPILTREITNELKILLNNEKYIRNFPHLKSFLRETNKLVRKRTMGGYETYKSDLPEIDFERLGLLKSQIANGNIAGARSLILENMRQGISPQFNFYFSALKVCLDADLPSLAKVLDDSCSKHYHKIPLKVNILWLRYEIISKYKRVILRSDSSSLSKLQPIKDQIAEFERVHKDSMNFQNYLQLTQLSLYIGDYQLALTLIRESYHIIDDQDKQQWLMYYITALKISARLYRVEEFHRLLKEWNSNANAKWVSHGCIRQIKAFTKLFEKKQDRLEIKGDESLKLLTDIYIQIDLLVDKYVNYKFDGLNAMKKLIFFLRRWADLEIKEIARSDKRKHRTVR